MGWVDMKAAFILPYFGPFDALFPFFLHSCGFSPEITWLVFTDNHNPPAAPKNVRFHNISFGEMVQKVQQKYDFPISLRTPYRLCNFKPAYGDIFSDYLSNFDFWGYCDCDLIWGRLAFYWLQHAEQTDRFGIFGHCSLFRNTEKYRYLYKYHDAYKIAFSNDYSFLFDEIGFKKICEIAGVQRAPDFWLGDFAPRQFNFSPVYPCGASATPAWLQVFSVEEDGRLLRHAVVNHEVVSNEMAYIHFLKRRMQVPTELDLDSRLMIVPNRILNANEKITADFIRENTEPRFYYDYWRNGLALRTIAKKLKHRFSSKRKRLLCDIDMSIKKT